MTDGFIRAAAATPAIRVADCAYNTEQIVLLCRQAAAEGASLVVFPELCVTGYTCGDLFLQKKLLEDAQQAIAGLAEQTRTLDLLLVVGVPVADGAFLYNCAAVLMHGRILGLAAKTHIPNYAEFYEARHFAPAPPAHTVCFAGQETVLGRDILFSCTDMPELCLGVEICEDLWVSAPPSGRLAAAGATVIANPSASDEVVGKADYRRLLVRAQSARLVTAYIYADAGEGESSTDMVFSGHNLLCENGAILSESQRFTTGLTYADLDLARMQAERRRQTTYGDGAEGMHVVHFSLPMRPLMLRRHFARTPFVPENRQTLDMRCDEILELQAAGLATRLRHTRADSAVLGLSGGLDSTLALIVTARAFDRLGISRDRICCVTMPGFGTTRRTKSNAHALAQAYGAALREIPIGEAVRVHFRDIGHDERVQDVTYENAQARERTQVLMDLANASGGLVIGTGDLSELALGWATYNGDHMSMYGVNASVPKTLVRHLVAYEASCAPQPLAAVLRDVLDTPVSPELLPSMDGEISQRTEDLVGPYELHDFFLYYMVRLGFTPRKIYRLACGAFEGSYTPEVIRSWLVVFLRRFFAQQFKRSCLPDGPKVGSVTLSPRGDWRMPSDACAQSWLDEARSLPV